MIPLFAGTLLIEPYGVYNLNNTTNLISEWNTYVNLPTQITFKNADLNAYPTFGITPVMRGNNWSAYMAFEIRFDFQKLPKPTFNFKIGGISQTWDKIALEGEAGLINIGEESMVSPTSRIGLGIPVFSLGADFNIK